MKTGKFNVVLDAFWGSSGKGKVATWLTDRFNVTKVSSSNYPNAGHCCGRDTYIITQKGIEQIGDVVERAGNGTQVASMNGRLTDVSAFVPDGIRMVNSVQLANGIEIECTDIHRFLVWNSQECTTEWVRSMDLNPNCHFFLFPKEVELSDNPLLPEYWASTDKPNKTALTRDDEKEENQKIGLPCSEERFAAYLGLLVGDGYYAKKIRVDVAFHTSQADVLNSVRNMYSEMGIENQHVSRVGDKDCLVLSTSQCSGLMELFEMVGLDLAVKDQKRTPRGVLTSNRRVMGSYLAGLFDSDGSVKADRITLSNCSRPVVRDAQAILHALGVSSFLTSYQDKHDDSRMTQFVLSVSGRRNLERFREVAGFLSDRKRNKLDELIDSREHSGQVIAINDVVRRVMMKLGHRVQGRSVRAATIERLESQGLTGPIVEVNAKYYVIPIARIGLATRETEVFDITVPGTHSYLANGCVSHNTARFEDGTNFVAKTIPTSAILKKVKGMGVECFLSPGSGFFWDRLVQEWEESGRPRVYVHGRASIVTPEHARREREGADSTKHIASTMQGSGAAISDKIMRRPDCTLALDSQDAMMEAFAGRDADGRVAVVDPAQFREMTWGAIGSGHTWLHEGSQGFALSIDHGSHYPFCISGDSRVVMADGRTRKIRNIQVGDTILSKDDAGRVVQRKVVNFWKNQTGAKQWFNVVTETSVYNDHDQQWIGAKLTGDHKVQTRRGKVAVQDLQRGDQVFVNENEPVEDGLQVFLGSMLGDGIVLACKKNRRRATLQISHGSSQRGYALAKAAILRGYIGGGERTVRHGVGSFKEGNEQVRYQSAASISVMRLAVRLGCYGTKDPNVSEIIRLIDERGLAVWYQDNGQRNDATNGQEVYLYTNGFSRECVDTLAAALEAKFNLHFSVYSVRGVKKNGRGDMCGADRGRTGWHPANEYPVLRLSRKDHDKWFSMIAKYTHPDLQHKLPSGAQAEWSTGWVHPGTMKCTTETVVDVIPSRSFRGQEWCYDIEVEGTHNFFVKNDKGAFNVENCTSRNCTLQMAMDQMAVPPSMVGDVYLNLRSFPIRVGNVMEDGKRAGYSGDFYPDCEEFTWERVAAEAGMPAAEAAILMERERTTVTKRIRRVCNFSFQGLRDAVRVNGATKLILNFVQYLDWRDAGLRGGPEVYRSLSPKSRQLIEKIEDVTNLPVVLIGTGALNDDVIVRY